MKKDLMVQDQMNTIQQQQMEIERLKNELLVSISVPVFHSRTSSRLNRLQLHCIWMRPLSMR